MTSSRPPAKTVSYAHPGSIRLPHQLEPAEVAFVGQVITSLAKTDILIHEVQRIRDGGLRFHSEYIDRRYSHDMQLSRNSQQWAYMLPGGAPVNAYDFAGTIKKHYLGR